MALSRYSSLMAVVFMGLAPAVCAQAQSPRSAPSSAFAGDSASPGMATFVPSAATTSIVEAPWWDEAVKQPAKPEAAPLGMDLQEAIVGVLMYSPQVRIAADTPVIRRTQIVDALARFDPSAFIDSKFTDTSDPVGNLLTTGGANRYIDQTVTSTAGLRKTLVNGGQFEAAHKTGYQDNNSSFFLPKNQATSRITLTYTQPLLNGSGRRYNTSVVALAELNTEAASAQLQSDLQDVILETHRTYWDVRLQRAALLQRLRLKQRAVEIQQELRARANFDVVQSQIARADAAVATRDAGVIRTATSLANAETHLRALINDPYLTAQPHELIPTMTPYRELVEPDLAESLTVALQNRPEIRQAFAEVRSAGVRADVSKNELLPVLNLLLGTYVSGLEGSSKFGDAWVDQFAQGRPTYWTGLQFEYPLWNRGANARMTQRRVELRQATNKLQQTMIDVRAETETAVREVVTTHREMSSKLQAMKAEQAEVDYLTSRWRLLAGDQQLAGVILNDLLSAQERLAQAEYDFAAAEAAYNVALVNLNLVQGTLLTAQRVEISEALLDGVPALDVRTQSIPSAPQQPTPPQPPAVNGMPPQPPEPTATPMPGTSFGATSSADVPESSAATRPADVLPMSQGLPTRPADGASVSRTPALIPLPPVDSSSDGAPSP